MPIASHSRFTLHFVGALAGANSQDGTEEADVIVPAVGAGALHKQTQKPNEPTPALSTPPSFSSKNQLGLVVHASKLCS